MAIVEDITERESDDEVYSSEKVLNAVRGLVDGLTLSDPVPVNDRDNERTINVIHKISDLLVLPTWSEISPSDQILALRNILGLYDPEPDSDIQKSIDQHITPYLSPSIAIEILLSLRQSFTSHPSLSSTSRALSRPAGGENASNDMQDYQPFKTPLPSGGTIANLLFYSITLLSSEQVEKNIGLILPPTLVMMDDYEPPYREKGAWILNGWMGKLQPIIMKRMGIDKLLLKSLIHTLSLHPNPPLKNVLEITLRLIERSPSLKEGTKERMEMYEEIMDKAIVQGWIYSPSGIEGRVVLIDIAVKLEIMCKVLKVGIVRWLKSIIPSLIGPLQYPPTPLVLPHYIANLSALLCVLRTIQPSASIRIARWRGQILNVLCRLVVQLHDRGVEEDGSNSDRNTQHLKQLLKDVFTELLIQIPTVKDEEYERLIKLSPNIFEEFLKS